jgi:hypothetical protein
MKVKLKAPLRICVNFDDETGELEDPAYTIVAFEYEDSKDRLMEKSNDDLISDSYQDIFDIGYDYSDFEEIIIQAVNCDGIEFYSGSDQLCASTNSLRRAKKFVEDVWRFLSKEIETEDYLPKQD